MKKLIEYARSFNSTPYKWGGNNPLEGFDCSGFVQWVLKQVGADPRGDQTSQGLFNYFKKHGVVGIRGSGSLVFYGKDMNHITHIAFCLDKDRIIHAGGGGRNVNTFMSAMKSGACVRENIAFYRSDVIAFIRPKYHLLENKEQ